MNLYESGLVAGAAHSPTDDDYFTTVEEHLEEITDPDLLAFYEGVLAARQVVGDSDVQCERENHE